MQESTGLGSCGDARLKVVGDQGEPIVSAEPAQPLGHVLAVSGSQATVGLSVGLSPTSSNGQDDAPATVGRFLGIRRATSLVIGMIGEISMEVSPLVRE